MTNRGTAPTIMHTLRIGAVGGYALAVAMSTPSAGARPSPGPAWTSNWIGTAAVSVALLTSAAMFIGAARRERSRPGSRRAWYLFAVSTGGGGLAIPAARVIEMLRDPGGGGAVGPAVAAIITPIGWCVGAAAAVTLLRDRTPRWAPLMWVEATAVALGVAALAEAVAGVLHLTLAPAAQTVPSQTPAGGSVLRHLLEVGVTAVPGISSAGVAPMRLETAALVMFVALTLGSAAVTRTSAARPMARLGLGLSLVLSANLLHEALAAGGHARPELLSGPLVVMGFAVVGLSVPAAPHGLPRVATLTIPDRRRAVIGVVGRRSLLPLLVSATSMLIVAATLIDAETDGPMHLPWSAAVFALAAIAVRLTGLSLAPRLGGGRGSVFDGPGTDDVTGLADRRALADVLAGEEAGVDLLDAAGGGTASVCLLIVDLDRFKDVNDGLGHGAGDRLLSSVAGRLQTVLRAGQMLARLGGDEFAVLLPGADAEAGRRVAEELRQSLTDPFDLDGSRVHLTATVGIAACRPAVDPASDLLRRADAAMYAAKGAGTGIEVYDPARDEGGAARLQRIDELRGALERGDIEVHLQPQVDLLTGRISGAEALARWRHPQDGVLLPDAFLPLAAQIGLMRPVATLVLDLSLAACAMWWKEGHEVTVSVNLGAEDLRDPDLPTIVADTLKRHDLPPQALVIEITEGEVLADTAATAALVTRWRLDGVSVAVDDYGTGYSSLSYLRDLPVAELKLDRAFATDLGRAVTSTIVRHTVAMAHGLGLRVVAEGVEDEHTAHLLTALACDVGQGLYFGGATAPAEFLDVLERANR